MRNRDLMKNDTFNYDKNQYAPVPFWVKLYGHDYPIMIICFRDFRWEAQDWIKVDGVSIEFPEIIEYVQQDFSKDKDTKRWYSKQEYMDEYILSKA